MRLSTPQGDKVRLSRDGGLACDREQAEKYLSYDKDYYVREIRVGRTSSSVFFYEHPHMSFNTVLFENVNPPFENEKENSEKIIRERFEKQYKVGTFDKR